MKLIFIFYICLGSCNNSLSKSNLRKKVAENWAIDENKNVNMEFDNRLWLRLQLCNAKTCRKCAKIVTGHGLSSSKTVEKTCQKLLIYKNCCSRTSILTRGF